MREFEMSVLTAIVSGFSVFTKSPWSAYEAGGKIGVCRGVPPMSEDEEKEFVDGVARRMGADRNVVDMNPISFADGKIRVEAWPEMRWVKNVQSITAICNIAETIEFELNDRQLAKSVRQ